MKSSFSIVPLLHLPRGNIQKLHQLKINIAEKLSKFSLESFLVGFIYFINGTGSRGWGGGGREVSGEVAYNFLTIPR